MAWLKIDDQAPDDPRFVALPRGTRLVHVEALAWSNRHGADGRIPTGSLPRITDERDPHAAAAALVDAGLWDETDEGWQIRWLLDDQPTAEEMRRQRAIAAERQRRKRRHDGGDHTLCDRCWWVKKEQTKPPRARVTQLPLARQVEAVTPDVTRDVTRESRHPDPSRPAPPSGGGDGSVSDGVGQEPPSPPSAGDDDRERAQRRARIMVEFLKLTHAGIDELIAERLLRTFDDDLDRLVDELHRQWRALTADPLRDTSRLLQRVQTVASTPDRGVPAEARVS